MPPPLLPDIGRQTESDIHEQNIFPFTELEKKIRNAEVEPSKSTNLASKGGIILGSKAKKTEGKKSKSVQIFESSSIQIQPIQASKKDTNNVNLDASYEKMVEKSTKIIDVKKKRYPENNSPILCLKRLQQEVHHSVPVIFHNTH